MLDSVSNERLSLTVYPPHPERGTGVRASLTGMNSGQLAWGSVDVSLPSKNKIRWQLGQNCRALQR